jgi:hypothetical protein
LEGLRAFGVAAPSIALNFWAHTVAEESSLRLNLPVCPEIVT